ncbi:hypothetical protein JOL62DRAFT_571498 [Phyllosticta paracitricarpa]|uniref:Uncharacterized protein n=1 Tax=Phyllosticta paracitricarpa TaxID=2016321 RepID=A0ABR1NCS8_9PEZI
MTLGRLLQDAGEEAREKTSQAVQEPVQERVERVQRATDKASQNVGQLTVEANDGCQQRAESTRKSLNDRAQRTSGEVDNVSQGRQRVEDDGDDLGNSVREVGEAVGLTSPELQANRVRDRSGNVADVEDEIRQENVFDRVQGLRLAHRVVEDVRDQALCYAVNQVFFFFFFSSSFYSQQRCARKTYGSRWPCFERQQCRPGRLG